MRFTEIVPANDLSMETVRKPVISLIKSFEYLYKVGFDLEDLLPTSMPHVISSPNPIFAILGKICIKRR